MTKLQVIQDLREILVGCTKCTLSEEGRSQVVFGCGSLDTDLMFVGEGPGADEDECGEPFSGPAGRLLGKMYGAIGYSRYEVFLDNIVKCRPPDNRKPNPGEAEICVEHVKIQIEAIQPRVLVLVGAVAAQYILNKKQPMKYLRGYWYNYKDIPTRIIYHSAYLLRLQGEDEIAKKQEAWLDLQAIKAKVLELKHGT